MPNTSRRPYQGAYRNDLEEPVNTNGPDTDQIDTPTDDETLTPEERTWKTRYGDLRSHSTKQHERIKALEEQLREATKKEVKFPSSRQEIEEFARTNPDLFRHMRSITMAEMMQQREDLDHETEKVKQDLENLTMELGMKKIIAAHPDFNEINSSEDFHKWAKGQPEAIQDWVYHSSDPDLCIRAIDFYKDELELRKKKATKKPERADVAVPVRSSTVELTDTDGKKMWKVSDIRKLTPRQYEKVEDEIELARQEGRLIIDE